MKVGDAVVCVDTFQQEHAAILLAIWGDPATNPAVNLVYVSPDASSVTHVPSNSARANCWKRVGE